MERLLLWSDFRIANKFSHHLYVYVIPWVHTILGVIWFLSLIELTKLLAFDQTVPSLKKSHEKKTYNILSSQKIFRQLITEIVSECFSPISRIFFCKEKIWISVKCYSDLESSKVDIGPWDKTRNIAANLYILNVRIMI